MDTFKLSLAEALSDQCTMHWSSCSSPCTLPSSPAADWPKQPPPAAECWEGWGRGPQDRCRRSTATGKERLDPHIRFTWRHSGYGGWEGPDHDDRKAAAATYTQWRQSHRLGKPPATLLGHEECPTGSDGVPPQFPTLTPVPDGILLACRLVIIKFVSRRVKAQVMEAQRKLKNIPYRDTDEKPVKAFLSDDWTRRKAHLAYLAQPLKQDNVISDTWVFDSRIFVKDKHKQILCYVRTTCKIFIKLLDHLKTRRIRVSNIFLYIVPGQCAGAGLAPGSPAPSLVTHC